jgi:subtilase family protein
MIMYWLEDQVVIAFHSPLPPTADRQQIIDSLQLDVLRQFLQLRGFDLLPFTQDDMPRPLGEEMAAPDSEDVNDPTGKYLFAAPGGGTTVIAFFHIDSYKTFHPVQDLMPHDRARTFGGDGTPEQQVVNIINNSLEQLRLHGQIPVVAATPNWLGGTTCFTHGCSYTSLPVQDDAPAHWSYKLPELSNTLQASTGKGVNMFVLDTMPRYEQIVQAAEAAGERNWLLQEILAQHKQGNIVMTYQQLPQLLREDADDQIGTGRDIYRRTTSCLMEDHGLFVTGIVHDIAPDAKIEYVRTLNDFGAGDIHMFIHELEKIHNRMLPAQAGRAAGDLYNQPVVINMSLVFMLHRDQAPEMWYAREDTVCVHDLGEIVLNTERLRVPLHMVIRSMAALGAIMVGSTGNDSNAPDVPYRIESRYPAAFPEVIAVGSVDKFGHAAPFANYPAIPPYSNGIATYGGGLPTPEPSTPPPFRAENYPKITVKDIDSPRGIYTSPRYHALSNDDPETVYDAPNKDAWAYWSGTSFAVPVISAVAARLLEGQADNIQNLPPHLRAAQVQWAITSAQGQQAMLTKNGPLPIEETLNVSRLTAVQE